MPGTPFGRRSIQRWNFVRKRLVAAGGKVIQNGDTEGAVLFGVPDAGQTAMIRRLLGIPLRRAGWQGGPPPHGKRFKKKPPSPVPPETTP